LLVSVADRLAPVFTELLGGAFERKPFIAEARRRLVGPAEGRVLEVGGGTGFNLPHYGGAVSELVVADPNDGMLRRARRRAAKVGRRIETRRAPAEALPFADASFDTVVGSLVLCSVADQERALAEIRRVLEPGGRYLFLEHVRSDDPKLARRQDQLERIWRVVAFGCHPNRPTLSRIESVFDVEEVERGELPAGARIVRPYVLGHARAD
jgi:ubiquinone/menaquinone biosynthesis C-methylase UbiE